MAYPAGSIQVTNLIGTTDASDVYATHWSLLGKGGHMSIDTVSNRDLIPSARREFGMTVTVNADGTPANNKTYILANTALGGSNNTLTDNANWIDFTSPSVITGSLTSGLIPVATGANTLGDSILEDTGSGLLLDTAGINLLTINSTGGGTGLTLTDDINGFTINSTGVATFQNTYDTSNPSSIIATDGGTSSALAAQSAAIFVQLAAQGGEVGSTGIVIAPGGATNRYGIIAQNGMSNGFGIDTSVITPTAYVHLGAAASGRSPLRMTSATALGTTQIGAFEFTTDNLFFTITTGSARKRLLMADPTGGLTSGRIPFSTTNGRLTDATTLTSDGTFILLGGTSHTSDSILQLDSVTQGFLAPRMNTTQKNAIASGTPTEGLFVYDNTLKALSFYNGSAWVSLASNLGVTGTSVTLSGNLTTTGSFNTTFAQQATATITLPSATSTLLANNLGITGGTTLIGDTASGGNLTLSSTSNATKGKILFGTSAYDEVNNRLGITNASPANPLSVGALSTSNATTDLARVAISTGASGNKGLIIQGVSSQTENPFEVQNNSATPLMVINALGFITQGGATSFTEAIRTVATFSIPFGVINYGINQAIDTNISSGLAAVVGTKVVVQNSASTSATPALGGFVYTVTANSGRNIPTQSFTGGQIQTTSTVNQIGTIADVFCYQILAPSYLGTKPTLHVGFDIQNQGHSSVTNAYGLRIAAPTGATNNFGIAVGGGFNAIGTLTPLSLFHVNQATLGNEVYRITSAASNDDPTVQFFQNKVTTTDATPTTLHTITIPASTTVYIMGYVVARRTGGSSGTAEDGAGYFIRAVYKNAAGTATSIGGGVSVTGESQAAWDLTLVVSSGNVIVTVTGAANNNISWVLSDLRLYSISS